jgi:hypothetical protein
MNRRINSLLVILVISILLGGCFKIPQKPEGTLSVATLLEIPTYDTQIRIYGKVSGLRKVMCTCFFLESEGENLQVWYDTMVEDNGTLRPAVDVQEIKNRDWVVVTGELKSGGDHYSRNDFWAVSIEELP